MQNTVRLAQLTLTWSVSTITSGNSGTALFGCCCCCCCCLIDVFHMKTVGSLLSLNPPSSPTCDEWRLWCDTKLPRDDATTWGDIRWLVYDVELSLRLCASNVCVPVPTVIKSSDVGVTALDSSAYGKLTLSRYGSTNGCLSCDGRGEWPGVGFLRQPNWLARLLRRTWNGEPGRLTLA